MSEREQALDRVFAAYAAATAGDALDAEQVRARILRSARAPKARPLRRVSFVLPLVAVFAASAAFAASQPELRVALATRFEKLLGRASSPHAAGARRQPAPAASFQAATPSTETLAKATANAEAATPIAVDALPLAEPATASRASLLPSTTRRGPQAATSAPEPTAPSTPSAELDAYRTAHRTHFDGGSPAASLAAWDRYLDDFPGGSFADDARFNRALCLIRLGRHGEARAALRPFAAAPAGTYRQSEAASLLASLPSSQP